MDYQFYFFNYTFSANIFSSLFNKIYQNTPRNILSLNCLHGHTSLKHDHFPEIDQKYFWKNSMAVNMCKINPYSICHPCFATSNVSITGLPDWIALHLQDVSE